MHPHALADDFTCISSLLQSGQLLTNSVNSELGLQELMHVSFSPLELCSVQTALAFRKMGDISASPSSILANSHPATSVGGQPP